MGSIIPAAWNFARALNGTDEAISKAVEAGKKQFRGSELPGQVLGILGRMENVDIVVPGHMSPVATQDYFFEYRDYIRTLRERVLGRDPIGRDSVLLGPDCANAKTGQAYHL